MEGMSTQPRGTSGPKVIAAIFGGIAFSFLLAGLGFLLLRPEASPCADGEIAQNRFIGPSFEIRTETFDSVSDAGGFICHKVPVLENDDWELTHISAERTVPTEFLVQGYGIGIVSQEYENAATGDALTLQSAPWSGATTYFVEMQPEHESAEPVSVRGFEATVYRFSSDPDHVYLQWVDRAMQHQAVAELTPSLTLESLVALMDDFE